MKKSYFLLCFSLTPLYSCMQEKKQPDLMHNPRLYFNRLPENAKTFVSECLFKHYFPKFTQEVGDYEKALQKIERFSHINFSFLNTLDTTKHLFALLFMANRSNKISCLDILLYLKARLPIADSENITHKAIHYLQIRYYTPAEVRNGLQARHFNNAQEYLNRRESQRINKLYLSASELATWKLIRLLRPTFDLLQHAPWEIKSQKKKDLHIAPLVAELLAVGANPRADCYRHYSLLVCAAAWRMPLVVELLLNAGADPNEGPCIPIWHSKGTKVTKLLLSRGADPDIRFGSHVAIMPDNHYSSVKKVRLLLQAGAEPNVDLNINANHCYYSASTPLICCLHRLKKQKNRIPLIEALIEGGANPTLRTNYAGNERTAQSLARNLQAKDIADLLSKPRKLA